MIISGIRYPIFRLPRKFTFGSVRIFFDTGVVNVRCLILSFASNASYTRRVRKTAVKNEAIKPIIKVVANPRMGPVPKTNNTMPVMTVVRLASKIAEKAFE